MISLRLTSNPIAADLERLIDKIANPGPRQRRMIGGAARERMAENFTRQGSGNGPWPQLAPATVRERQRLGFAGNRPILVRTGAKRSRFTNVNDGSHISRVFRSGGFTVFEEGSADDLDLFHERGTIRMPQRSVTLLDAGQENRIFNVVELMLSTIEREVLGR